MTPIFREVHRWMSLPHIWGQTDCITVLADWVETVTGRDPMADVRMTYTDAGSCQRETGFIRNPVEVMGSHLAAVGITQGNQLCIGDVAVINRRDEVGSAYGAMWLGMAWACKGPSGTTTLAPKMVEVLAFWSVGYEG